MADILDTPDEEMVRKAGFRINVAGLSLTVVWLAAAITYVALNWSAVKELPPNAIGDLLAGVSAPLAFLWLVLGFLQQGHELRHSAKALWLQGKELQNSVEQQRELVKVTREQLQFESKVLEDQRRELHRASQPMFETKATGSTGIGKNKRRFNFTFTNVGKPCTGVALYVNNSDRPTAATSLLNNGQHLDVEVDLLTDSKEFVHFVIQYIDERLRKHSKTVLMDRQFKPHPFVLIDLPLVDGWISERGC